MASSTCASCAQHVLREVPSERAAQMTEHPLNGAGALGGRGAIRIIRNSHESVGCLFRCGADGGVRLAIPLPRLPGPACDLELRTQRGHIQCGPTSMMLLRSAMPEKESPNPLDDVIPVRLRIVGRTGVHQQIMEAPQPAAKAQPKLRAHGRPRPPATPPPPGLGARRRKTWQSCSGLGLLGTLHARLLALSVWLPQYMVALAMCRGSGSGVGKRWARGPLYGPQAVGRFRAIQSVMWTRSDTI